ncbi:MAG: 50S ribosomal protein L15 [Candidatus Omnitrophica bacterium]|nr:50S ribosomal protein L15 [Candidatus Omnitrophota bacterium]
MKPPAGAHRRRKYLGRGPSSGHGKTSSRGSKGQTSRSGRATYPGFEGGQMPLIRKVPKRGFTSKFKKEFQLVNIRDLARIKEPLATLEVLEARGVIKNKNKPVKILGDGEITIPVSVQAHAATGSALQKIKDAGGKLELINV